MLVKRQNNFLRQIVAPELIDGVPVVPLGCVTQSMLLGDGSSNNFDSLLKMYVLDPAEAKENDGIEFMLPRILHSVRCVVFTLAWPSVLAIRF